MSSVSKLSKHFNKLQYGMKRAVFHSLGAPKNLTFKTGDLIDKDSEVVNPFTICLFAQRILRVFVVFIIGA